MPVPELEPFCNSWIVTERASGKPVFETWKRSTVERVNQDKYKVWTAYQWLTHHNKHIVPLS